jgi:predicted DNA-binding antitoxin AbrB/MazE fold protein
MTTIDAVYTGGVFRPAGPPDLPDGAAVRLQVVPTTPPPPDAADVLARILASAAKARTDGDDPSVTSRNVDEVLYGGPRGAR